MGITVDIRQMTEFEDFLEDMPDIANRSMSLALNGVLGRSGLVRFRKAIGAEVDFGAGYLADNERLGQTQYATPSRLEARITGRQRATSLARFATSGSIGTRGGVRVRVKTNGASKFMPGGFLVRLNAGRGITDDSYNVGLAVRLKDGQVLNKRDTANMVRLEKNVVLLYGPSIDQVLRQNVADQEIPKVAEDVATEFFRQFARLTNA